MWAASVTQHHKGSDSYYIIHDNYVGREASLNILIIFGAFGIPNPVGPVKNNF